MFRSARVFDSELHMDTWRVTDMRYMFAWASTFNNGGQPLVLNTSLVLSMAWMFRGAESFDQTLSFDVARVTDMTSIFDGMSTLSDCNKHLIHGEWSARSAVFDAAGD